MLRGIVLAVALAAVATAASAAAADDRSVVFVNHTGKPIDSLYVSDVASDDWEDNVLGDDVLADGESVEVTFSGYDAALCHFDVLATNEAGDSWLLPDVDLCAVTTVAIAPRNARPR